MLQMINEAEVKATWSPIIESATGISDVNKLNWLSKYCHFHKLAEDSGMLNENVYNYVHMNPGMNVPGMGPIFAPGAPGLNVDFQTQTRGSGDKPFSLLPLSMQVAAQTVGLDLVPVVPMGGPYGMLTYLDFPYSGGALENLSVASGGQGGADGRIAPIMIKVDWAGSFNTESDYEPGDVFYITDGAGSAKVPYRFTVVGRSRIDGFIIFKVDTNDDTTNYSFTNATWNTGNLVGSAYTLADVFSSTGTWYLSSTSASANNVLSGTIASTGKTPELVKALEDHVSGVTGRGFKVNDVTSNDPYLREEGESTKENLIGLKLFNKSVAADSIQVAAAVTREQVQDLKQYGIDAVAQVEAVLINELTQTINKSILERLFRLGATNAKQVYDIDGTNLNLYVGSSTDAATASIALGKEAYTSNTVSLTTVKVVPTSGDNTGTLQRKIMSKILAAANLISIRGRRGAANFAVTNGQLASALQDIAGFVPYPLTNTVSQSAGSLFPIGSIAGVNIYVDPNMSWQDTRICIGRKGDANSPGLVFMPYLMAESVQTIAEGTMAPKLAVKSRFKLVEAGFFPQIYYLTLGVKFSSYGLI
jgi:hypothetical protein